MVVDVQSMHQKDTNSKVINQESFRNLSVYKSGRSSTKKVKTNSTGKEQLCISEFFLVVRLEYTSTQS